MGESAIVARYRESAGKGVARKTRAAGRLPAVLYGRGKETIALSLDPRALYRLLSESHAGRNTLIDLKVEERPDLGEKVVMVKDLQREPVGGRLLHADLYEIDLEQKVHVSVPVHLKGTAHGVTMGGVLDHSLRELEFDCFPRAIPDEIVVDVAALDIGDSIHVRDVALPADVTLRTDPDLSIVSIVAPVAEEVAEAAPEGEEAVAAEGAEGETPSEKPAAAETQESGE